MAILSIDTSVRAISLGLLHQNQIYTSLLETQRGQAEFLVPRCQDLCEKAGISLQDLHGILVHKGPGSFTGIRIGLVAAQSLAVALSVPVLGVDGFALYSYFFAQQDDKCDAFCVVLQSGRQELYAQIYDAAGVAAGKAFMAMPEDIFDHAQKYGSDVLCIGNAPDVMQQYFKNIAKDVLPAGAMLQLYQQEPEMFLEDVSPIYLRGADVSTPKRKARTLEGEF